MKAGKSTVVLVAVLTLLIAASGGWFAQKGMARAAGDDFQAQLLEEVVERIGRHYVDDLEVGDLYKAAVEGVVGRLGDPNSRFLEAADWENVRIRTEGEYGGVGLEVMDRDGYITVVAPIPGTPGARAGLRPGDRIVEVDGESVEGWATDQAVGLLRGRPGTSVRIGVRRLGVVPVMPFEVTRAVIQVPSAPFTMLLEGGIGYVPVNIFNGTTVEEVRSAIDSLSAEGMSSLVLDLRNNRGGLLDEGVGLTDLFLDPDLDIVEIRGRASRPEVYRSQRDQSYPSLPVVVLIGPSSASAAEILAGALQDHDRALLIGATTFGKGSVQSLFPLSGGNVLKLTTARWFTPSGRSIQKERSAQLALRENGAVTLQGDVVERPDLDEKPRFASVGGRLLRGGGGIVPDLWVMQDTLTDDERDAVRATIFSAGGEFFATLAGWALQYIQEHPGLGPSFAVTEADLRSFHADLVERGANVAFDDLLRARRYVEYHMESEIALQAWDDQGRFGRRSGTDAQLRKAVELLTAARSQEELFALAGTPFSVVRPSEEELGGGEGVANAR